MFPTTVTFSPNYDFMSVLTVDPSNAAGILFKLLIAGVLIAYSFFALFLYLRIRILSLTLVTPNGGLIRYLALLHFLGVLGLAFLLCILLLF
jgi:hypothetical protein